MAPDEDENQGRGYDGLWEEVFGKNDDLSLDEQRIRVLIKADHQTQKDIRALRLRLGAAEQRIKRLRNVTISLLSPIMLAGLAAFFYAFADSAGLWSKLLVIGFAIFGFFWLRGIGKEFDDVTRD